MQGFLLWEGRKGREGKGREGELERRKEGGLVGKYRGRLRVLFFLVVVVRDLLRSLRHER